LFLNVIMASSLWYLNSVWISFDCFIIAPGEREFRRAQKAHVTMALAWAAGLVAALLALPSAVLFLEIMAASLVPRPRAALAVAAERRRLAILVPAHNESIGLLPTLDDLRRQLRDGDRLLVVADNCSDDTAAVAAEAGAEVAVRSDLARIGKGYALDFGIQYLARDPPEVVIVVDADCRLGDCAIDQLAAACAESGRPCQALDLLTAPNGSTINHQVAEFAWRVKNWIRPLGLQALGLPCQLMGTGMAFPWTVIQAARLSSGSIAEDLKLGLELTAAGHAPLFCPSALVTSHFPNSVQATTTQRQRWEQGHLDLIRQAPGMIATALRRRDLRFLALILDLTVPPLALLGMLLLAGSAFTGLAAVGGVSYLPFILCLASLMLVALATSLAWIRNGRDVLPLNSLILVAPYLVSKLRLYLALISGRRASGWIRTDRK